MQKNRLGWSYAPKSPIFISAVVIGILLAMGVGGYTVYWYSVSSKPNRETLTFGLSILGSTIALYGLLRGADSIRQANAEKFSSNSIAFVQRWNSPSYLGLKTAWRKLNDELDALTQESRDPILRDDVEKRSSAVEVLNFFEEMATGVNSGTLDNTLLRRYFEVVVIRAFDRYEFWIRQHRIRKTAPGYFDELEKLSRQWKRPES